MKNKFVPGQTVYVLERNRDDDVVDYSGYMFLAECKGVVIVSAFFGECEYLEYTLQRHVENVCENGETEVGVYPVSDCFETREEAEKLLMAKEE